MLVQELNRYAPKSDQITVREIPEGNSFLYQNGYRYTRGRKRVKRIECTQVFTGKIYLFHPEAKVKPL